MLPGSNDMVEEGIPSESTTLELDRMTLHNRTRKSSGVGRRGVMYIIHAGVILCGFRKLIFRGYFLESSETCNVRTMIDNHDTIYHLQISNCRIAELPQITCILILHHTII